MSNIPSSILHCILLFLVIVIVTSQKRETRSVKASPEAHLAAMEATKAAEAIAQKKFEDDAAPDINHQISEAAMIKDMADVPTKENMASVTKQKFHEIAKNAKIYYVGVYESAQQSEEQRKIFDQCQKQNEGKSAGDCHTQAYMQHRPDLKKAVTIHVNTKQPIILVLSNYEAVDWIVKGNTDKIRLIYATGYYGSEVHTKLTQGKIYGSFYQDNICSGCLISYLPYWSEYKQPERSIMFDYFGKDISSFQGEYYGKTFHLD